MPRPDLQPFLENVNDDIPVYTQEGSGFVYQIRLGTIKQYVLNSIPTTTQSRLEEGGDGTYLFINDEGGVPIDTNALTSFIANANNNFSSVNTEGALDELFNRIVDIRTLAGIDLDQQHLGAFNYGIITNNTDIRTALQDLEQAISNGNVVAANAINLDTGKVELGGTLDKETSIALDQFSLTVNGELDHKIEFKESDNGVILKVSNGNFELVAGNLIVTDANGQRRQCFVDKDGVWVTELI